MGFKFRTFNEFEKNLDDQLKIYLGKNLKLAVENVDSPRKEQIQFIQKAQEYAKKNLENTDPNKMEKVNQHFGKIMTGIALILDSLLPKTSALTKIVTLGFADGSFLKGNLKIAIGHDKNNQLTSSDRKSAIHAAEGFLNSLIYVSGYVENGKKDEHPFVNIAYKDEFNSDVVLKKAAQLIQKYKGNVIDISNKQHKERIIKKIKEDENLKGSSGYSLNPFNLFSSKKTSTPESSLPEISNNEPN